MAESQDTAQERTEQPTPKRLRDAREKGQVARSREFSGMAVTLVGAGSLLVFGAGMIDQLQGIMREAFTVDPAALIRSEQIIPAFSNALLAALKLLAWPLLILMIVAITSSVAVGGWIFSIQNLAFKGERINPLKGLARIFSVKGLLELLKAVLKLVIVGIISTLLLVLLLDNFIGLGREAIRLAISHAGQLFVWCFISLAAGLIIIAAVDVPIQVWQHLKQLRMTRQEIKDESKETEGRPEVRAKIRSMQQRLAEGRMMSEVPKADVVITNPTHYAVALRYDDKKMKAPQVLAKGADLVAIHIRQVAQANKIPMFAAPLLARALYASTALHQEIPAELYVAVAQVLAFVNQVEAARTRGVKPPNPPQPKVPAEFEEYLRRRGRL